MSEQRPASGPSLIGAVLKDSYRIERMIGEGGMGVVYEAAHTRLPRRFAVKLLRGTETVDDATRERFRREAFIASALGHRHICEVIDLDAMADGTLFMVMEYLEGESLAGRLDRERGLSPARALAVASTADAVRVASPPQPTTAPAPPRAVKRGPRAAAGAPRIIESPDGL
ncbi:MAG: protein kinase [Deltaproteobacteria bacterium]|nr:protein kinase [Deltaproteobacteria bacterium]